MTSSGLVADKDVVGGGSGADDNVDGEGNTLMYVGIGVLAVVLVGVCVALVMTYGEDKNEFTEVEFG